MRKIIFVICMVVLQVPLFVGCLQKNVVAEEGELANGFSWESNYNEITITGYEGGSTNLVIPEKINDKPVTKIEREAFSEFEGLESVIVPGSIKVVGAGAFRNCTNLKSIELGEGVETINSAFIGCTSLESIEIPNSINEMYGAFENCYKLRNVNIPNGVENLMYTFSNCKSLAEVVVPQSVQYMIETFYGCEKLTNVNVPQKVTELDKTFAYCSSLKSIELPNGMVGIYGAFDYCTALEEIEFPATVESVSIMKCDSLKKIVFPTGNASVSDCLNLESIVFDVDPGLDLFYLSGLPKLKNITVPTDSMMLMEENMEHCEFFTNHTGEVLVQMRVADEEECGEYSKTISVNGKDYPVYLYGDFNAI